MISTHAPLAGRDSNNFLQILRGVDFNPRAPCGARLSAFILLLLNLLISTHAPLAGRDYFLGVHRTDKRRISTHAPLAGRDIFIFFYSFFCNISTHAPLAGRDAPSVTGAIKILYFNPRAPCGARRLRRTKPTSENRNFNPRAPCGARHNRTCAPSQCVRISTHAPLAGRDSKRVQITMHIFAITDKFQMLLHRMPPVRAFCSFLMQENHADFGCEPPK